MGTRKWPFTPYYVLSFNLRRGCLWQTRDTIVKKESKTKSVFNTLRQAAHSEKDVGKDCFRSAESFLFLFFCVDTDACCLAPPPKEAWWCPFRTAIQVETKIHLSDELISFIALALFRRCGGEASQFHDGIKWDEPLFEFGLAPEILDSRPAR